MKTAATFIVALLVMCGPPIVAAQGFAQAEHTTCYSWNGGNHSSGSFIQCDTFKAPPKPLPVVVPAPLPPPVVQSPVMMPMSSPVPEPKRRPIVRKKPKPVICK